MGDIMNYWWIIVPSIVLLTIYKNIKKNNSKKNNKFEFKNELKNKEKGTINNDIKIEFKNNEEENKSGKEWYKEYLKTDHWLNLREEALKRAGKRCQVCGYRKNLQVHHNTYKNIGHEDIEDLVVLCWKCHKTFHHK